MNTPVYIGWNKLAAEIHADNIAAGWWKPGVQRNVGELLMLCVSEISEGWDGFKAGLMDDHLPHRWMIEVELADAQIRLLDIAGAHELDVSGAAHDLLTVHGDQWDGVGYATARRLLDIVSEISRAMEGARKGSADAVVTYRQGFEVGIAAALLRIDSLCTACGYDLDGAREEKRQYNRTRADHKPEARAADGGKKF